MTWRAGVVARLGAALAVFVSGLVHLQLYFDGYRDFPNENLGRSFLLNAAASVVLAIVLVFRREAIVRIASAVLLVGTLIAFALSRTDDGIFGFTERGLNPVPQTTLALFVEIVGLVLLTATFVPRVGPGEPIPVAPAAVAGGLALAVAIGGGVLWARDDVQVAPVTSSAETISSTAPTESTTPSPNTTAPATATPDESVARTEHVVRIVDFTFEPPTLEVPVGTTVEWVNEDSFAHSVVAEDRSFESEDLESGDRFTFTFTAPGEFRYICGIHPSMQGVIVVTG